MSNFRLCHISDTHGNFPKLNGKYSAILHTGDFFPNSHYIMAGNKDKEAWFQMNWLKENISDMKKQINGHPYLFILGNHDFVNPVIIEEFLNYEGIKAFDLTNKITNFENINFYGFPYIPVIGNNIWNYEKEIPEMQEETNKMIDIVNSTYIDVVAAHSAIYKTLDLSYSNQLLGSTVIANAFDYKISKDMMPVTYLHGHIHESAGISMRSNLLISNAALTCNIIEF